MFTDTRPPSDSQRCGPRVLEIALGVCIGVLAATAITWVVGEVRLRWQIESAATALKIEAEKAQRAISQSQREAEAARRESLKRQEALEADQRQRLADRQRAEYDAQRSIQNEAVRKEEAWKRFFKPRPECAAGATSVDCANDHIRAKREFEAKYSSGQL